jgi:hypothetical protein
VSQKPIGERRLSQERPHRVLLLDDDDDNDDDLDGILLPLQPSVSPHRLLSITAQTPTA